MKVSQQQHAQALVILSNP